MGKLMEMGIRVEEDGHNLEEDGDNKDHGDHEHA